MPHLIIHKDDVWNIYTTVSDGPIFASGVKFDDLRFYWLMQYGLRDYLNFKRATDTARTRGSSSGETLKETVSSNRAGKDEKKIPFAAFCEQFLTIPDDYESYDVTPAFQKMMDEEIKNIEEMIARHS